MARQARHRSVECRVVRGRGQGDGRGEGARILPEAGGDRAADPQRPYAHDRTGRRGRDPDRVDALQPGGGQAEGERRADRLEAARPRLRPRRRHCDGEARVAPARGAAVRGFRAVARRPAHHQGARPRAGQPHRRQLVRSARLQDHRSRGAARGMGDLGEALADAVPARAQMKIQLGGDCEGQLYLPRDAAPAGAVVILHERYGLVQHTLDLAQRLAGDGYVALAPDLFSRWQGDRAALERGAVRVTLPDDEVAEVIDRAIDAAKTRAGRVALMGVCQSGRYPIVVGSRRRDLAACIVFYGGAQQRDWEASALQPRPMGEMLRELRAPALFVFGERDHTISLDNVRRVRDALEDGRRSYRMKVFADMPHGFLNDTMPGRYRPH